MTIKNPYGFRVDINDPKIRPVYERYKKWKGLPRQYPISDDERREFEAYILGEKKNEENMPEMPKII